MARSFQWFLVAGCFLTLTLGCFGPVLLRDRQFAYRDSAEFYYPLYQRVQQEWEAGRWPLWEPEENGGMPLLGNPAAAVLYPGKLVFALPVPYAWGARLYVVLHVALAFVAQFVLLRGFGTSGMGAALGALAYAFGGPVLGLYCNVIYLVGAAWAPLALVAVDRLVRRGSWLALVGLAAVLALMILGGDPETAYLVVVLALAYALLVAWNEWAGAQRPPWLVAGSSLAVWTGVAVVALLAAWPVAVLGAAAWIRSRHAGGEAPSLVPESARAQLALAAAWLIGLAWSWRRIRGTPAGRRLGARVASVLAAGVLALGLAAAQVLPVVEFSRSSTRAAAQGQHAIYPFSVEPWRAAEWVWPNLYGAHQHPERNWMPAIPPRHVIKPWVPSLYLGGLTLLLAAGGAGIRGGPPWRAWLTLMALGSFVAALGEFAGPVWWAREVPSLATVLGAHDQSGESPVNRADGGVSDGDGGLYWLMAAVLPGFATFRYPGKLLTFTALGLSALAGLGWDLRNGIRMRRAAVGFLGLSLSGLVAVALGHAWLVRFLAVEGRVEASFNGPFDPAGAVGGLERALAHGAAVMAVGLALVAAARRGRPWAGPLALVVVTADLAVANASLITTVPQSFFDRPPKLARLIEEAEKRDPSPGPFRVHRMLLWFPPAWYTSRSPDRLDELTRWQYDTLRPKYGLLGGLEYTVTGGSVESYDYGLFFSGFEVPLDTRRLSLRGVGDGQPVFYYTRRGFDLWNTRYFILPMEPGNWRDGSRGFAAFLADREMLAPPPSWLEDSKRGAALQAWVANEDWQLLKNTAAYPRAWVVHRARFSRPIRGFAFADRARMLKELLLANDAFWFDPGRRVFDPHEIAWVETDDPRALAPYARGRPPGAPAEPVRFVRYEPQRVELEVRLDRPGIVVLADRHDPGWRLELDGKPAPVLRVNRMMRGAAVEAGVHRLVYVYRPLSFRIGAVATAVSLVVCLFLALRAIGPGRARPAPG